MYFVGVTTTARRPVHDACWFRNQLPVKRVAAPRAAGRGQLVAPALLFVALCLQLWARVAIITKGYELEELRTRSLQSDVLLRQKRLEYAFASSPANLAEAARERLAFAPLAPQRMRTISEE